MFADKGTEFIYCQELFVGAAVVGEAWLDRVASVFRHVASLRVITGHGKYGEVFAEVDGVVAVTCGNHFLVNLLTGPNSHDWLFALGADRFGNVGDPVARDLGDEQLSACGIIDRKSVV